MACASNSSESEIIKLYTKMSNIEELSIFFDVIDYKHIVLGLIFLRYISDAFEEMFTKLSAGVGEYAGADPEDKDEYSAENVFFVPADARWTHLLAKARQPEIGIYVDAAMESIEKVNPSLRGVSPNIYGRPNVCPTKLGTLIVLIENISTGTKSINAKLLGFVFQSFLQKFTSIDFKRGTGSYTPQSVAELLVKMIKPNSGRIFDPCCGSGQLLIESHKFVKEYHGNTNEFCLYGLEANQRTWQLAKMNLAINGIDSVNVNCKIEGSSTDDALADLHADFIISTPLFGCNNSSSFVVANYNWLEDCIHQLAAKGRAGIVLSKSTLFSKTAGKDKVRKKLVAVDNVVDCIVNLPPKLFSNTLIPTVLWLIDGARNSGDSRANKILFIDASNLGENINRTTKVLTINDINQISSTYHAWRTAAGYKDIDGFCASVTLDAVQQNDYVLNPPVYV